MLFKKSPPQRKNQCCVFPFQIFSNFLFLNSKSEDSQLCTGTGCLAPCAGTGFGRTTEVQTSSMRGMVCPLEKYGMPRLWLKQEVFLGGWIFLLWSFFFVGSKFWNILWRWSNWEKNNLGMTINCWRYSCEVLGVGWRRLWKVFTFERALLVFTRGSHHVPLHNDGWSIPCKATHDSGEPWPLQ